MRSYPRNSPEAAARVVALALLADGHFSRAELEAMERGDARQQLGISGERLEAVVHALCEDLLATRNALWTAACSVDRRTLEPVLDEIDEPMLRWKVLQLCMQACAADGELADSETGVIRAAVSRWGLCEGHAHGAGEDLCRN